MIAIGPYVLSSPVLLAPMAGITDRPFRLLCREMGAGLAASEMVSTNPRLRHTPKSRLRVDQQNEPAPRVVQIAGADPLELARAARYHVSLGAQIIDINMGCPAKKVCNKAAGSALLKDESLVADILEQVVSSVNVPVTLKIRTGWDPQHRNARQIARIAQSSGIAMLTIHGRTRACRFKGMAEYDTIAAVKQSVEIPVIANGDINSSEKARAVLAHTRADGVMVGRAARGRPWIFREIAHYLKSGEKLPVPDATTIVGIMVRHLQAIHRFYGDFLGLRIARKHMGWYLEQLGMPAPVRKQFNRYETTTTQHKALEALLMTIEDQEELVA